MQSNGTKNKRNSKQSSKQELKSDKIGSNISQKSLTDYYVFTQTPDSKSANKHFEFGKRLYKHTYDSNDKSAHTDD